ncbi:MAG: carbohydrate ABC transporter permease [Burkholderiales bacterium]|nr:carbohydrate ABC transporter permease [Burkholderiales bacterium]
MRPGAARAAMRGAALMVAAGLLLAVWVVPVALTLLTSFKNEKEVLAYPPSVVFEPTIKAYGAVLTGPTNIVPNLMSSLIVAIGTTLLTIVIAVPAAYAFARLRLPGKKPVGFYVLATQLVPPIGLIIPYFLILNRVGWMDSYRGLILIYLTFSLPFAIWLLVSYFEDIPREMEEAALLDRASRWQAFWHVVLPQARGAIAVTVTFVFLNAWNEFLFAVVLGGATVKPVTVAMYNYINTEQTQWAQLSAAALVAMLPVIVLGILAQKHIVSGLSAGAVKGVSRR